MKEKLKNDSKCTFRRSLLKTKKLTVYLTTAILLVACGSDPKEEYLKTVRQDNSGPVAIKPDVNAFQVNSLLNKGNNFVTLGNFHKFRSKIQFWADAELLKGYELSRLKTHRYDACKVEKSFYIDSEKVKEKDNFKLEDILLSHFTINLGGSQNFTIENDSIFLKTKRITPTKIEYTLDLEKFFASKNLKKKNGTLRIESFSNIYSENGFRVSEVRNRFDCLNFIEENRLYPLERDHSDTDTFFFLVGSPEHLRAEKYEAPRTILKLSKEWRSEGQKVPYNLVKDNRVAAKEIAVGILTILQKNRNGLYEDADGLGEFMVDSRIDGMPSKVTLENACKLTYETTEFKQYLKRDIFHSRKRIKVIDLRRGPIDSSGLAQDNLGNKFLYLETSQNIWSDYLKSVMELEGDTVTYTCNHYMSEEEGHTNKILIRVPDEKGGAEIEDAFLELCKTCQR